MSYRLPQGPGFLNNSASLTQICCVRVKTATNREKRKGGNVGEKTCIIGVNVFCRSSQNHISCRRSSVVEQLIRNQQVGGSNPPVGFHFLKQSHRIISLTTPRIPSLYRPQNMEDAIGETSFSSGKCKASRATGNHPRHNNVVAERMIEARFGPSLRSAKSAFGRFRTRCYEKAHRKPESDDFFLALLLRLISSPKNSRTTVLFCVHV